MKSLQRCWRPFNRCPTIIISPWKWSSRWAIGLYQAALKAAAEGKHVGYAASPDALDVEFTGIASSEGPLTVAGQKFDIGGLLADGSRVENVNISANGKSHR